MTEKILVPVLGESITEATISRWLKSKGDNINADEPIVELETDKVNLEVPSPISGTLTSKEPAGVNTSISVLSGPQVYCLQNMSASDFFDLEIFMVLASF